MTVKLILCAATLWVSMTAGLLGDELVLLTGEWPPYVSQDLTEQGPSAVSVRAICREAGYELRLKFYPWKREEAMVEAGEAFGAFPYCLNGERVARFLISDPTNHARNIFYFHSGNPKTPETLRKAPLERLKGLTVGVIRGSFLINTLREAGFVHIVENDTTIRLFQQMFIGRIDLVMGEQEVLKSAVAQLPPGDQAGFLPVEASPVPLLPNGLIVSKDYPGAREILDRLNQALGRLKSSGAYGRLINTLGLYLK